MPGKRRSRNDPAFHGPEPFCILAPRTAVWVEVGQPVLPRCPSSLVCVALMTKSTTNDLSSTIEGTSIEQCNMALHLKVIDFESDAQEQHESCRGFSNFEDAFALSANDYR
jgi:hypothetical protein